MRFSHSKLQCCINNPMDYNLSYKIGIHTKEKAKHFQIGSAVHWGFENNTEDLTPWFQENGTLEQQTIYSPEQEQAEAMVHGYFYNKDKIMEEILKDYETGRQLEIIEEFHELELTAKLKSLKDPDKFYDFLGIIDWLLLTNKGFIVEDYKTSSDIPDFNKYIDQVYRYDYILSELFPEVPIYKNGIVNIVKSKVKKLKNENDIQFRDRWKKQYEQWPSHLINVHQFEQSKLDKDALDEYILNFRRQADLASSIDENNLYYINYQNAKEPYKSEYYDIYFNTPNAFMLYNIKDTILDPDTCNIVKVRDCVASDMEIINTDKVLYKFEAYQNEKINHLELDEDSFRKYLHNKYIVDDSLLDLYKSTFDFVSQQKGE